MRKALRNFVLRKNREGGLLWVVPVYAAVQDLRHFPVRRFVNLLKYLTRVWRGTIQPLKLDRSIKTSVFYLGSAGTKTRRTVVKLPRLDNRHARAFQRSIREPSDFADYSTLLEGLHRHPIIGRHCVPVYAVKRDGGYESPLIEGHNLASVRDQLSRQQALPRGVDARDLARAIEELDQSLAKLDNSEAAPMGDWALHNLIYEASSSTIKNVDLEGFFSYGRERLEAAIPFVRAELGTLRTLVQLVDQNTPRADSILRVFSALRSAATSDVSYSGRAYSAGYHSVAIDGHYFRGQRDCIARLDQVPYDFTGKTVLDLGCNTGGMLHSIAERLSRGIGIDIDAKCIEAANLIRDINGASNLEFHSFNLDREPLERLDSLCGPEPLDICFLLSVCMWLDDPERVIAWVSRASRALLFESNGSELEQERQVSYVRDRFGSVQLISPNSPDDPGQKKRALYLCTAR